MHAFYITPVFLLELSTVAAVAVSDGSNSTYTVTVGWVADPYDRGTFSLIVSCLLTLSLCVWSAIHLNVPPPNQTRLKVWARTWQWVIIGIFGPELVVFAAWRQYISAHELQDRLKRLNDMEKAGVRLLRVNGSPRLSALTRCRAHQSRLNIQRGNGL